MNEVTDVEVESVGLVEAGVNKEKFFLRKSTENRKVATMLRAVAKAIGEADGDKESEMNEEEKVIEEVTESEVPVTEPVAEPEVPVIEPVEKMEATMPEKNQDFSEKLEMLEKAKDDLAKSNADLAERLAKAEARAAKQEEQSMIMAEIQKAKSSYAYIPVSQTEIGNFMYWVRKADSEKADWIESVMKSVDAQLRQASLYTEVGSSYVDSSDPIAKAANSANPKADMLNVDPKAAQEYLAKRRSALKTGSVQ